MNNDDIFSKAEAEMKLDKGFVHNNNYKLIEVKDNYCKLEGIMTKTSLNPYNMAHGGYIFGLADTAAGIASRTNGRIALTLGANINYLKKATGQKLIAEAQVLKAGRTISTYEVSIYNENQILVAKSTIDYCYIEK